MLEFLLMPPCGPLLLAVAGALRGQRRGGRTLLAAGLLLGYLGALPITAALLGELVDPPPPLSLATARESGAQAVVVLAGGLSGTAPEYGGVTLNAATLGRLRYGALLAREVHLPVLVTGGYRDHDTSAAEGELMAQALHEEFGLSDVIVEARSRDTHTSAVATAALLRERGMNRILLVSHALHLPRAQDAFLREGFTVVPAPTLFFTNTLVDLEAVDFIPQPAAPYAVYYALHELIGRLLYRLRDGPVPG